MDSATHARVKHLFLEALARPSADRAAVIDAAGVSAELRREVESLLAHHCEQTLLVPLAGPTQASFSCGWDNVGRRANRFLQPLRRFHWPLATKLLLTVAVGFSVSLQLALVTCHSATQELLEQRRNTLVAVRDLHVASLCRWFEGETSRTEFWAQDEQVIALVETLWQVGINDSGSHDETDIVRGKLRDRLGTLAASEVSFALWTRDGSQLVHPLTPLTTTEALTLTDADAALLVRVFRGETVVRLPFVDEVGSERLLNPTPHPRMAVMAPVRSHTGTIMAALAVRLPGTEQRMLQLFESVRLGTTGKAYPVDGAGRLLADDRDGERLRELGLVPDEIVSGTLIQLALSDPGGNLLNGYHPAQGVTAWPRTRPAHSLAARETDVVVEPYRDVRGVPSIGAWAWLPKYQLGVVVEQDYAEATSLLAWLDLTVKGNALLLVESLAAAGLIALWTWHRRHRHHCRDLLNGRIGAYQLESIIGEGGMGTVYRARHRLLQRPAGLKVLKAESAELVARFEREVQSACRVQHANTVEIYDYGQTDDGRFYYAMELVEGLTLMQLVRQTGPLPPSRAVHLMRQAALALRESHRQGLVHRDITPTNIMVCCRGGEADVVKLLDFGLVKDATVHPSPSQTAVTQLLGTPRYLAPERIVQPHITDRRSDLYSLGAVFYFLLVGREVFDDESSRPLLHEVLLRMPAFPTDVPAVPELLQRLVLQCLAKTPAERPDNLDVVLQVLSTAIEPSWTAADAQEWWQGQVPDLGFTLPKSMPASVSARRAA